MTIGKSLLFMSASSTIARRPPNVVLGSLPSMAIALTTFNHEWDRSPGRVFP